MSSPWVVSHCARPSLVSPSLPSVTSASSMLTTSSFSPPPRLTFSLPLMLVRLGCSLALGVGPTKSATMIFGPVRRPDCCVHLSGVPLSSPPLSLGALTSTFCAPAGIVSFTRPVPGVLVKASSLLLFFRFRHLCTQALPLGLSTSLTILPPFSNSTSLSVAGVVTSSVGDALHLALERAFSPGACVLLTTPRPPITATVFRLSSSAVGSWSHWCASALFLHPASCHGHLSWLFALVTPPVALPRN